MKHALCRFHQGSIEPFCNTIQLKGIWHNELLLDVSSLAMVIKGFWSELTTIVATNNFDFLFQVVINHGLELLKNHKGFWLLFQKVSLNHLGAVISKGHEESSPSHWSNFHWSTQICGDQLGRTLPHLLGISLLEWIYALLPVNTIHTKCKLAIKFGIHSNDYVFLYKEILILLA